MQSLGSKASNILLSDHWMAQPFRFHRVESQVEAGDEQSGLVASEVAVEIRKLAGYGKTFILGWTCGGEASVLISFRDSE
jgi:hypothetical protein